MYTFLDRVLSGPRCRVSAVLRGRSSGCAVQARDREWCTSDNASASACFKVCARRLSHIGLARFIAPQCQFFCNFLKASQTSRIDLFQQHHKSANMQLVSVHCPLPSRSHTNTAYADLEEHCPRAHLAGVPGYRAVQDSATSAYPDSRGFQDQQNPKYALSPTLLQESSLTGVLF